MNKTITITDGTLDDFADFFHHEVPSGSPHKFKALFDVWINTQSFIDGELSIDSLKLLADRFAVFYDIPPDDFMKMYHDCKLAFTVDKHLLGGKMFSKTEKEESRFSIPTCLTEKQAKSTRTFSMMSPDFEKPVEIKHISMSKKPSWKNAPEWANWLAKNSTGEWVWYEVKPDKANGDISTKWSVPANSRRVAAEDNSDWDESLEERPAVISTVFDADNQRLKDNKKVVKIEVDWENAPSNCDVYVVRGGFENSNHGGCNLPPTLYSEQRPVKKPIVEVGQEWQLKTVCGDDTVFISEIIKLPGSTKLDCGWVDNAELVVFKPLRKLITDRDISRMLVSDFVKDFARIK